jgi:pimeloyl-ACP methyl ester carboxylesterase
VTRFVVIDAPLPGVGPWEDILKNPLLWHFRFGGPDMERLVAGRERIYLDRFWNEFSANPARFGEAARTHYAKLYAMPGAMHSGFMQFATFDQDALDNQQFLAKGKLTMPVLAIGGEKSFGTTMAKISNLRPAMSVRVSFRTRVIGSWRKTRPQQSLWCEPSSMREYDGIENDAERLRDLRLMDGGGRPALTSR